MTAGQYIITSTKKIAEDIKWKQCFLLSLKVKANVFSEKTDGETIEAIELLREKFILNQTGTRDSIGTEKLTAFLCIEADATIIPKINDGRNQAITCEGLVIKS